MSIADDVARCIAVPATHPSGLAASASDPTGDAVISECGTYRYFLTRRWRPGNRGVLWNMLNSSTADALKPDQTVRKMVGFSTRWDFDYAAITNLWPFRSRYPSELKKWLRMGMTQTPIRNQDEYVREALKHVSRVVLAWGANGVYDHKRAREVEANFLACADAHLEIGHLGLVGSGDPGHPLTLGYTTPFTLYPKAG